MSDEHVPDLGEYVDRVIDAGITDVAEVAMKVRADIPAEVIEAHVLRFLRVAVRDRMARRRAHNPVIRGAAVSVRVAGRPTVGASVKRAGQRAQFAADRARWLADTLWTGTRRVSLGEATSDDLTAAAWAMREQAERSAATAARYDEIALALIEAGVDTVADLPDTHLHVLMNRD